MREACDGDEPFLYDLYASTRAEEMAAWGLEAAQQEMFLELQFSAQRRHYEMAYAEADHRVVLFDGKPAGRLLVFRSELEIILVDIALLPEHRNRGIGAALIDELLGEAERSSKPVRLHVVKENRARRLYERLGFEIIQDLGIHFKMEWRASGSRNGDLNNA